MSHQDAVTKLPIGFKVIGSTKESKLTIIEKIEIAEQAKKTPDKKKK